jgi:hypothetical protein
MATDIVVDTAVPTVITGAIAVGDLKGASAPFFFALIRKKRGECARW